MCILHLVQIIICSSSESAQYVEEVWQLVGHVDLVDHLPVGGHVLQARVPVDAVRVPDDVAAASTLVDVGEGRHGEEQQSAGSHEAPQLSDGLGVAVRRQRIAVATESAVLQRRVGERGVEQLHLTINQSISQQETMDRLCINAELMYTLCLKKNCTPKACRHKFCYFPNTKISEIYVL